MQEKKPIAKLSSKELRLGYNPKKKKATKKATKKTAKQKKR